MVSKFSMMMVSMGNNEFSKLLHYLEESKVDEDPAPKKPSKEKKRRNKKEVVK